MRGQSRLVSRVASWDAIHHRRTFHCPDTTWERVIAYSNRYGVSRSAVVTQALELYLSSDNVEEAIR